MRLRYIGAEPITFVTVGDVEPGDEFTVPDDQADAFLRRTDIEDAPEDPAPASKPRKPPKAATPTDPKTDAAPAAAEEG